MLCAQGRGSEGSLMWQCLPRRHGISVFNLSDCLKDIWRNQSLSNLTSYVGRDQGMSKSRTHVLPFTNDYFDKNVNVTYTLSHLCRRERYPSSRGVIKRLRIKPANLY